MMAIIEDTEEDWECFVHYRIPLHIWGNMKYYMKVWNYLQKEHIQNNVITPDFDNNSILCDLTRNDWKHVILNYMIVTIANGGSV